MKKLLAAALAATLFSSSAFAAWVVNKDPMGPGYLVSKTGTNIAPFKAATKESADAQAEVLNKFDQKQDRKNK